MHVLRSKTAVFNHDLIREYLCTRIDPSYGFIINTFVYDILLVSVHGSYISLSLNQNLAF